MSTNMDLWLMSTCAVNGKQKKQNLSIGCFLTHNYKSFWIICIIIYKVLIIIIIMKQCLKKCANTDSRQ